MSVLVRTLLGLLLGVGLGLVAVALTGEPWDFAALRFWVFPGLGGVAGAVAALIPSRRPAPIDDSLPLEDSDLLNPNLSPDPADIEEMRLKLERRTARLSKYRGYIEKLGHDLEGLKRSYRDLYHNAPVMYFGLDPQARLVTFNDTLLNTLGYKHEDLHGQLYIDALPAEPPADRVQPPFPKTPGHREGHKSQWLHKNGSHVDVWIRSTAIVDEAGSFVRWRCSALDLTERNRLADELRSRGDELERTNSRLRQINSELEDFTHVVSHDLKEPLRTLQAFSHILAEEFGGQLGPDGFQYINHLVQASSRLGRLIDELLNLSQAGRNAREPQVFNLNEAVATVRRDLSDLLQRRSASLVVDGSLPDVLGDPQRIVQLLSNLVGNGLKYNKNAAPQITIGQAEHVNGSADQLTFFVRDNGIGIDPRHHQRIFGLFRRLHTDEEYEGTGAGLAICRKIVEAHGGRIWVESKPGDGATFFFTLPSVDSLSGGDLASPRTARLPEAGAATKPSRSMRGVRILLVEDMYEIGTIIKKLGQRSGLSFTWFTTAEEAWKSLQTEKFDFILLDKNLPGMDGLELCRRIRQELRSTVPVALFSQEQRLEDLRLLRKAGANFFISKELLSRPAIWQEKLRELLTKARAKAKQAAEGNGRDGEAPEEPEEATTIDEEGTTKE
jgi:PAS domain S-box-containing protein